MYSRSGKIIFIISFTNTIVKIGVVRGGIKERIV